MGDYRNGSSHNLKLVLIMVGIILVILLGLGGAMLYVMKGSPTSKYNKAVNDYNAGNYMAAAQQFEALGDYRDSKKRASESIQIMHYTFGKTAFENGEYEKAVEEYEAAGEYQDAKEKLTESKNALHYTKGISLSKSGDIDKAIEELKLANGSYDSDAKLFDLYVLKGDKELENKAFDKAMENYKTAGTYKDSTEEIKKCNYFMGEDAESRNEHDKAVACYVEAGDYQDAADKIKGIYYNAGIDALANNQLDKAAEFLKIAADYKDAASKGMAAFYSRGVALLKAKDFESASEFFKLAGSYKNAKELSYVSDAEICLKEGDVKTAVSLYSKVSKKTTVSGFNVQARKTHASQRLVIDKAHGAYTCKSHNIYATKTFISSGMRVTKKSYFIVLFVTPTIVLNYDVNPDGTFNIYGTASYVRFHTYSEDAQGSGTEMVNNSFRVNKVKKIPSTIKLPSGAKLKYKNGTFTLTYAKNKNSGSTKYKFRTTIKYKK
jgi:tetratricopeptide (TPR) repeat protein